MEFVHETEVAELLRDHYLKRVERGPDQVHLEMDEEGLVRLHLACGESSAEPAEGATVVSIPEKGKLAGVIEHIIHLLGLEQILLIPVGKWRRIFDAVAFGLAENEEWQEIDAAATVELNTRDPLLCLPGDYKLLVTLIGALLSDADQPDQGLYLVSTVAPVLIEIVPDGAVRVCLGNAVLADEVTSALAK